MAESGAGGRRAGRRTAESGAGVPGAGSRTAEAGAGPGAAGSAGGGWVAVAVAALLLWLAVAAPLALGRRTLYYRDVFNLHLPLEAFGARELDAGRVPALNPTWALGQPYRGNPQAAAFYPGRLLHLALPFWSAFNLHYVLHWLLAALTLFALARELGMGRVAALTAALAWAGGGWTLTALSFHHVIVATAWWPLALWGAARGGRRGIAIGGVACGMALLGGAWDVAALGLAPLALVALGRHGLRRGALIGLGTAALGALIALPQIVATLRVLPFTLRGAIGVPAAQVALYALAPARLLELALPLPFGWPGDLGRFGYWSSATPRVPLVLSLHFGLIALCLAAAAARRRPAWAVLAAAGPALAWAGGLWPAVLSALSAGLFRYPEKFVLWTALAGALLAGWGLDALLADPGLARRFRRGALAGAVVALAFGTAALAFSPALEGWWRSRLLAGAPDGTAELQVALAGAGLLAAALLLAGAAAAARAGRGGALAAVQLAGLLQLAPLVMTAPAAPFRSAPEWLGLLPAGAAVVSAVQDSPFDEPRAPYRPPNSSVAAHLRLAAADLEPAPGVLQGLAYPLAPDADGFASPLTAAVRYRLPGLDRAERAGWLRAVGADAVAIAGPPWGPGLSPLAHAERAGVEVVLYRVEDTAPAAWWPRRVEAMPDPAAALTAASRREHPRDLALVAAVPAGVIHNPGGRVRMVESEPDRLTLEVESEGGVAVVRRAYQRLWRVREVSEGGGGGGELSTVSGRGEPPRVRGDRAPPAVHRSGEPAMPGGGGKPPAILPVDLELLGVVVPPGRRRIELSVSARPETAAGIVALAALAAALAAAAAPARRPRSGSVR